MGLADVPGLGDLKGEATFVAHPGSELGPVPWPPADLLCCEASVAALLSWTVSSAAIQRSTQNWYGLGESDCLFKTKHCDGLQGCGSNVISAQCSECQREEIQKSAGKRRE